MECMDKERYHPIGLTDFGERSIGDGDPYSEVRGVESVDSKLVSCKHSRL